MPAEYNIKTFIIQLTEAFRASEGKQKDKLMNPYMWNVKTLLLNSCLDNTHGHKNKQMNLLKL